MSNNNEGSRQSVGASKMFEAFAPSTTSTEAEKPEMRYVSPNSSNQRVDRGTPKWNINGD